MSAFTECYVARPTSGVGPGVLVLHEAWGLTHDIRWAADRLAAQGYVAFVPDLTPVMRGPAGAVAQLTAGRGPLIEAALTALDKLSAKVESQELGVVGFSMGASLALLCDRHPRVGVISVNYGIVPPRALTHRPVPVVASFGDSDRILPGDGARLRRRLERAGVEYDLEVYDGVGHSFMTPIGRRSLSTVGAWLGLGYHSVEADHAWGRIEHFLADRLHPAIPAEADWPERALALG